LTGLLAYFALYAIVSAQSAPVITDFSPATIPAGQSLQIKGQNLTGNVQFTNVQNQTSATATGSVSENDTLIIVTVPSTLEPGNYSVSVSGPGGFGGSGMNTLNVTSGKLVTPPYTPKTPVPIFGVSTFGDLIGAIFNYSFQILGVVIFFMFLWAGFMWLGAGGNPGTIGKAKSKMTSAILGAILLLSSYLILNTINPDLINVGFTLKGVKVGPPIITPSLPPGPPACSNPQILAQQNREPFPRRVAADLAELMTCISSKLPGQNLGSVFTYEETNDLCNYTRGNSTCGSCAHAVNSCHYGGATGTDGALAVDYGNEVIGNAIVQAANSCGAKSARCENSQGQTVACNNSAANHVHVNAGSCDSN